MESAFTKGQNCAGVKGTPSACHVTTGADNQQMALLRPTSAQKSPAKVLRVRCHLSTCGVRAVCVMHPLSDIQPAQQASPVLCAWPCCSRPYILCNTLLFCEIKLNKQVTLPDCEPRKCTTVSTVLTPLTPYQPVTQAHSHTQSYRCLCVKLCTSAALRTTHKWPHILCTLCRKLLRIKPASESLEAVAADP